MIYKKIIVSAMIVTVFILILVLCKPAIPQDVVVTTPEFESVFNTSFEAVPVYASSPQTVMMYDITHDRYILSMPGKNEWFTPSSAHSYPGDDGARPSLSVSTDDNIQIYHHSGVVLVDSSYNIKYNRYIGYTTTVGEGVPCIDMATAAIVNVTELWAERDARELDRWVYPNTVYEMHSITASPSDLSGEGELLLVSYVDGDNVRFITLPSTERPSRTEASFNYVDYVRTGNESTLTLLRVRYDNYPDHNGSNSYYWGIELERSSENYM